MKNLYRLIVQFLWKDNKDKMVFKRNQRYHYQYIYINLYYAT